VKVGICVLACFIVACGGAQDASREAARPVLQPVRLPVMASAAEPVQKQIRERDASLRAALDRPNAAPADLADAFGDLGKLLIAAEYYDAAETCFVNARALAPGDMRWPYFLGHVFRYRNEPAKAAGFFEQALVLAPDHVPSLVWLAEMNLALSRLDVAEPALTKARSLDPTSGAVLSGLGRVALARQDYAQAATYLEDALARGPQATRLHYPLALAYRGLGNREQAEKHLQLRGEVDLPPIDPLLGEVAGQLQNAAAFETRGSQAIQAREWRDAITNLRQAVELAPDNAFTRLNLGTALYMERDATGALEEYRAALRLSPGLARAHFGVGVIMEGRRLDRAAIDAFTEAVKYDPAYVEAHFSLANALRRTGRVQESLPHYVDVLRANPAVSQASFGYAMGLVRLGRYQEARARLEADTKAFPDQPGFAHALARLLAAAPVDRVRDGARALSIMKDLMQGQQTVAMAETMAMALAESGRFDEAVQWQRDALASATAEKRADVVRTLAVNLQSYQNRQPCRTPWADDDPVHHPVGSSQ
jgi:tetratricopeptide (TPR) repeat protein